MPLAEFPLIAIVKNLLPQPWSGHVLMFIQPAEPSHQPIVDMGFASLLYFFLKSFCYKRNSVAILFVGFSLLLYISSIGFYTLSS